MNEHMHVHSQTVLQLQLKLHSKYVGRKARGTPEVAAVAFGSKRRVPQVVADPQRLQQPHRGPNPFPKSRRAIRNDEVLIV